MPPIVVALVSEMLPRFVEMATSVPSGAGLPAVSTETVILSSSLQPRKLRWDVTVIEVAEMAWAMATCLPGQPVGSSPTAANVTRRAR